MYGGAPEMGSEWIIHARLGDDFIPFREKSGAVNGAETKMEAKSLENNMEICRTPDPPGNAI